MVTRFLTALTCALASVRAQADIQTNDASPDVALVSLNGGGGLELILKNFWEERLHHHKRRRNANEDEVNKSDNSVVSRWPSDVRSLLRQLQTTATLTCTPAWGFVSFTQGAGHFTSSLPVCSGDSGSSLNLSHVVNQPCASFVKIGSEPSIDIKTTKCFYLSTDPYTIEAGDEIFHAAHQYPTSSGPDWVYFDQSQLSALSYTNQNAFTCGITTTDLNSGLIANSSFKVKCTCQPTSVTFDAAIPATNYFAGDPDLLVNLPNYSLSPACGNEVQNKFTYSLLMQDDTIPPTVFSITSGKFKIKSNKTLEICDYNFKLVVTETNTGLVNSQCLFTVTVLCSRNLTALTAMTTLQYKINPYTLEVSAILLPAIDSGPPSCQNKLLYRVYHSVTLVCPTTWVLSCNPTTTTNIQIGTTSISTLGLQSMRLQVTNTQNNNPLVINFDVNLAKVIATVISVQTPVPPTRYRIGQGILDLNVPTMSWTPYNAYTAWTWTKAVSNPSFATINASPLAIRVNTSTLSNTGTYTVQLRVTETQSGLIKTTSFTLVVYCLASLVSTTMPTTMYYLGDPSLTTSFSAQFTYSPSGCPNQLTYSMALSDGSPLPSVITHPGFTSFQVYQTTLPPATYVVRIKATDPNSQLTADFLNSVIIRCVKTSSVLTNPIPASTDYYINTIPVATTTLQMPTYQVSPSICASYVQFKIVNASDACQPWITPCEPTDQSPILISTTDKSQQGFYSLVVKMLDQGQLLQQTPFSVVIIYSGPTSITRTSSTIPDQTYLVGAAAIMLAVPSFTWEPAGVQANFSYQVSSGPSFVSASLSQISISTSDKQMTGQYSVTILTTETKSGLTNSMSFNLRVLCASSIAPSTTIAPVTYYIGRAAILIPLSYEPTPLGCPTNISYVVTLSNGSALPAIISYASGVITIYSTNVNSPLQTYTVQITGTDSLSSVSDSSLSFNVEIQLAASVATSITRLNSIAPQVYVVSQPKLVLTPPSYSWIPSSVDASFTFSVVSGPAFVLVVSGKVEIFTSNQASVGSFTVTLRATETTSGLTDNSAFQLTVYCASSITLAAPVTDVSYYLTETAIQVPVSFATTPASCPHNFVHTATRADGSALPSAITFNPSTAVIRVYSGSYSDATGIYSIKVSVSDSLNALASQTTFNIRVQCFKNINIVTSIEDVSYQIDLDTAWYLPLEQPQFIGVPTFCPDSPITFQIISLDGPSLPAFLINDPIWMVETQDQAFVGTHHFKVIATQAATGLINDSMTFTVIIKAPSLADSLEIDPNYVYQDIKYFLGTPTLLVDLPYYTVVPPSASVSLTYTLDDGPSFATLQPVPNDIPKLAVFSDDQTSIGFHALFLTVTEQYSNLSQNFVLMMLVSCVQSISVLETIPAIEYFITSGSKVIPIPNYSIDPSTCPYEVKADMIVSSDGSPLLSSIFLNFLGEIQIESEEISDVGTYLIRLVVIDFSSQTKNSDLIFTVIMKCVKTVTLVTNPIPALTVYTLPQVMTQQTLQMPTFSFQPSICAPLISYQIAEQPSGQCASWFSCSPNQSGQITFGTTDKTLVGMHTLRIEIVETSTGIIDQSLTFGIDIQSKVTSLTLTSQLNAMTYIVGTPEITQAVPVISWTPSDAPVSFTYTVITGPSFVTISGSPMRIRINTNNQASTGTHSVTIRATETFSSLIQDASFSLKVLCASSIGPSTPIVPVTYYISQPAIFVPLSYVPIPSGCPTNLFYVITRSDGSSLPASITLTGNSVTIFSTDFNQPLVTSTVKITANDSLNSLSNSSVTFDVIFKCASSIALAAPVTDVTYYLTETAIQVPVSFVTTPASCPHNFVYTVTLADGSQMPSAITFIAATTTIRVYSGSYSNATGSYSVKVSVTDSLNALTSQTTFNIRVQCFKNINIVTSIEDVSYQIDLDTAWYLPLEQPQFNGVPTFCPDSPITFQIISLDGPSLPAFLINDPIWMVETQDQAFVGTHHFKVIATQAATGLINDSMTFTVIIKAPSLAESLEIDPNYVYQDIKYALGTPTLLVDLPYYTVVPPSASVSLTYTLDDGPSFATLQPVPNDIPKLAVFSDDQASIGFHVLFLTVTEQYSNLSQNFVLMMLVSCVQSISVLETIPAIEYFITSGSKVIPIPNYSIDPSTCPYEVQADMIVSSDGSPLPSSIFLNFLGEIQIESEEISDVGTYLIRLVVIDFSSQTKNSDLIFTVIMKCVKTVTLVTNPIPALTVYTLPQVMTQQTLQMPTFSFQPSICAPLISYQIAEQPSGQCASWFSCSPNQSGQITFGTTDKTLAGLHTLRIKVDETSTGIIDQSVTFGIDIKYIATSLTLTSQLNAMSYTVGAPAVIQLVPAISWTPSDAPALFTYTVITGPSFVTISGTPQRIRVSTSNPTETGNHSVTIRATETYSGLTQDASFSLRVLCASSIAPSIPIAPVTYYISQPAIVIPLSYTPTPSGCPTALSYVITRSDFSALPAAITLTGNSITVFSTDFNSPLQTYTVRITAIDQLNSLTSQNAIFDVILKCASSIGVLQPIADVSYKIDLKTSFSLALSTPSFTLLPAGCQANQFSYLIIQVDQPQLPAFISEVTPGTWKVQTQDLGLIGQYTFKVVVTESSSGLVDDQSSFKVTIQAPTSATELVVDPVTIISDKTYEIGASLLALQVPKYSVVPLDAYVNLTFLLDQTYSFAKLVPQSGNDYPRLEIYTNDPLATGQYTVGVVIKDTYSHLSSTTTFKLTIQCVQSIQAQAATAQTYFIQDPALIVDIPLFTLSPPTCPYKLSIQSATLEDGSNLPSSITFFGLQLFVHELDYSATQDYSVRVVVRDPYSGVTNSQLLIPISIKCTKSVAVVSPIPDISYKLDLDHPWTLTLPTPSFQALPSQCLAYRATFIIVPVSQPLMPPFLQEVIYETWQVATQDVSMVGIYFFKVIATEPLSGLTNDENIFKLVIIDADLATDLMFQSSIPDQTYQISSTQLVVPLPLYSIVPPNADTSFVFSFVFAPPFVTITPGQASLEISTSDPTHTGEYMITVSLTEEFSGLVRTTSFKLTISCVLSIQEPSASPLTYFISDPALTANIPLFTLSPPTCPYNLEASSVKQIDGSSLPSSITFNGLTLRIDELDFTKTQDYFLRVTVIDPFSLVTAQLLMPVSIKCAKSIEVKTSLPATVLYLIGAQPLTLQLPVYGAVPAGCPIGDLAITLLDTQSQPIPLPSFITLMDSTTLTIWTDDEGLLGEYGFRIRAYDAVTDLSNDSLSFDVKIKTKPAVIEIAKDFVLSYIFKIGSLPLEIPIPSYITVPPSAESDFVYQLVNPPYFAEISGNVIEIDAIYIRDAGTHTIILLTTELLSGLSDIQEIIVKVVEPDCVVTSIWMSQSSLEQSYTYFIDPETQPVLPFLLPTYQILPTYCSVPLTFSLIDVRTAQEVPIASFSKITMLIATGDYSMVGKHYLRIKVSQETSEAINSEAFFTLTIDCKVTSLTSSQPVQSSYSYFISDAPLVVSFPDFQLMPAGCMKNLAFRPVVIVGGAQSAIDVTPVPDLIKVDEQQQTITISSTNELDAGKTLQFTLHVSEPESGVSDQDPFSFQIMTKSKVTSIQTATAKPTYTQEGSVKIKTATHQTSDLREIFTTEDFLFMKVTLVKLEAAFLEFDSESFILTVFGDKLAPGTKGSYRVVVSMEDIRSFAYVYIVDVIVDIPPASQPVQPIQTFEVESSDFEQAPAQLIPIQPGLVQTALTAKMSKVDMAGKVTIHFSEPILKIKDDALRSKQAIVVSMIWMNNQIEGVPKYSYELIGVYNHKIELRLKFERPDLISRGPNHDAVQIRFRDQAFFVRMSDSEILSTKVLTQSVPPQLSNPADQADVEYTIFSAKSGIGMAVATLVAGGALSVPVIPIVSKMNAIQMMSMQQFLSVPMPANALNFMESVDNLLRGERFNPSITTADQTFERRNLNAIDRAEPVSKATFYLMLVAFGIAIPLVIFFFQLLFRKTFKKHPIFRRVPRMFKFAFLIRIQQFGYIYFVLVALQGVQSDGLSMQAQMIYTAICLWSLLYPACVAGFLYTADLNSPFTRRYFGAFYKDLKTECAQYTTLFLVRRLLIGLVIAFTTHHFIQLWAFMLLSLATLVYVAHATPFDSLFVNVVEFTNEIGVLFTIYISHGFVMAQEPSGPGWVYIIVVMVAFFAQSANVLISIIKLILKEIKVLHKAMCLYRIKHAKKTLKKNKSNKVIAIESIENIDNEQVSQASKSEVLGTQLFELEEVMSRKPTHALKQDEDLQRGEELLIVDEGDNEKFPNEGSAFVSISRNSNQKKCKTQGIIKELFEIATLDESHEPEAKSLYATMVKNTPEHQTPESIKEDMEFLDQLLDQAEVSPADRRLSVDELRNLSPQIVFQQPTPQQSSQQGLRSPSHPGALRSAFGSPPLEIVEEETKNPEKVPRKVPKQVPEAVAEEAKIPENINFYQSPQTLLALRATPSSDEGSAMTASLEANSIMQPKIQITDTSEVNAQVTSPKVKVASGKPPVMLKNMLSPRLQGLNKNEYPFSPGSKMFSPSSKDGSKPFSPGSNSSRNPAIGEVSLSDRLKLLKSVYEQKLVRRSSSKKWSFKSPASNNNNNATEKNEETKKP